MSLVSEQFIFLKDVVKLIEFSIEQGYIITGGELYRTQEQQNIYLKENKTKTKDSQHLKRLAIDLNFFNEKGELIQTPDIIGKYWESLSDKNRWGGSWRGLIETKKSSFVDKPHFERKI
ncbi:MAG: M15 family peptidase [Sulfurimonas sp.]|uniref:M15 family metallopeptidase n=1 Tax=Sulfurimonas sp. TaxID=2022749 RepID=UPI003D101FDA